MANCIICHLGIIIGKDNFQECPNGHPTHGDCLQEWLTHASNCPLCNEPYPQNIIEQFKDYIDKKELEKKKALEEEIKKETVKKIKEAADKIALMKFIESIESLIKQKKYDYALSRLELHDEENISTEKGRKILFLKGKLNYLKGRYDLAINYLFKLVKEKFDYPDGFLFLGLSYEALGLTDKAKWAYDRIN
ncbi:MAG: RING finger domain-containing protein [Promethearchaeota archaeon]